jgi:hypothetical protein
MRYETELAQLAFGVEMGGVVDGFVLPGFFSSPQPTISPKLNSKANAKIFFIFSILKSKVIRFRRNYSVVIS